MSKVGVERRREAGFFAEDHACRGRGTAFCPIDNKADVVKVSVIVKFH